MFRHFKRISDHFRYLNDISPVFFAYLGFMSNFKTIHWIKNLFL